MWKNWRTALGLCYPIQKYLGLGDLEVSMGKQKNGHCFSSVFLCDSLSKETISIGKYQGETDALRD